MSILSLLLVAVGGAAGSVCRYLMAVGAGRLLGSEFPWGTMAVNVIGSFAMGIFVELLALRWQGSVELRMLVAVGFLGGFTTLSTYSLDAVFLWERGAMVQAVGYAVGSVVFSLAALVAGLSLVRTLSS